MMLSIEDDSRAPIGWRRSVSLPFHPLLSIGGLSRKSLAYDKLPRAPLKLTVVKLDGSSFVIGVTNESTVAEVKQAVELVFSHIPKKGPGKVSWLHVWSHFCLCYEGQKLTVDTDSVGDFRIKDGDQLHFVRHVSATSYNILQSRSKKRASFKQRQMSLPAIKDGGRRKDEEIGDLDGNGKDREDAPVPYDHQSEGEASPFPERNESGDEGSSFIGVLDESESGGETKPTNFVSDLWNKVGRILQLYRKKPQYGRVNWRIQ